MTNNKKQKTYNNVEIKELKGSEVEVAGEIPTEFVESNRNKVIQKFKKDIDLPGFRKGKVPEEMVVKHVGEQEILKEMAEMALGQSYADIVADHKLDVIGRPQVTITKLATGNPIGFKIKSAVFPKIELPDYKKIAENERKKYEKEKDMKVTDEEVQKELKNIQKAMSQNKDGNKEGESAKKEEQKIDDDFARSLGNFKDLADLKEKIKKQMILDKQTKQKEKHRLAIADAIIAKSKIEVPSVFIEGELDQMVATFNERVDRVGMKLEDYLKQIGKTLDDLRNEWRTDAEKRAKLQLILNEISKREVIIPDLNKVEMEIKHLKEHYPEADMDAMRSYVVAQMVNEKVFEFLEGEDVVTLKNEKKEKVKEHKHSDTCEHD